MEADFRERLLSMKEELSEHKRDRAELKKYYIQERLSSSLQSYYKEINNSYSYLRHKDEVKVVKELWVKKNPTI